MKRKIQIGVGDSTITAKGFIEAWQRALSNELGRDYKNVHTDVRRLEQIGLIDRNKEDKVKVPWDIVEAKLRLAA